MSASQRRAFLQALLEWMERKGVHVEDRLLFQKLGNEYLEELKETYVYSHFRKSNEFSVDASMIRE